MITTSILDTDLYKLTQQQAVLEKYPNAMATYEFICRSSDFQINKDFIAALKAELEPPTEDYYYLQPSDRVYLENNYPYFKPGYLSYLERYRFNSNEIDCCVSPSQTNLKDLKIKIRGPWHSTILWEVPLMALISEIYFKIMIKGWNYKDQEGMTRNKANQLADADCEFIEFGTRRRRDFATQDLVVRNLRGCPGFLGTSNVYLALKNNVPAIGTQAHEWIMGVSGLESLRYANRFALKSWNEVYPGQLGIALTDTFGTDAFLEDFDVELARIYDGVRQDSGDPIDFTNKMVNHYKKLGIDYRQKKIIFSDSLDIKKCIAINAYCKKIGIPCCFGIGTHFTNYFQDECALNIVVKMTGIAKDAHSKMVPVVKLSDDIGKVTGDPNAVKVAKWTFFESPLY